MIDISNYSIMLDTFNPNITFGKTLRQGNTDFIFKLQVSKGDELQTISDGATVVYYISVFNEKNTVIATVKKTDATVSGNIITINGSLDMVDHAGKTGLTLEITDGGNFYTCSMFYNVQLNYAYAPKGVLDNLPVWDNKANKDLSNVSQADFDARVNSHTTGVAKADLSNVDNADFKTKGVAAGLADNDLSNVKDTDFFNKGYKSGLKADTGVNYVLVDASTKTSFSGNLPTTIRPLEPFLWHEKMFVHRLRNFCCASTVT